MSLLSFSSLIDKFANALIDVALLKLERKIGLH